MTSRLIKGTRGASPRGWERIEVGSRRTFDGGRLILILREARNIRKDVCGRGKERSSPFQPSELSRAGPRRAALRRTNKHMGYGRNKSGIGRVGYPCHDTGSTWFTRVTAENGGIPGLTAG